MPIYSGLTSGDSLLYEINWGKLAHLNLATPAYASSLYGKGWFCLKLPFLINVYYTQNYLLDFMVRKRTIIKWGNMARSCKKCGFFVSSLTSSTKDIGYCLFVDPRDIEKKDSEKRIKITYGKEIEIAKNCEGYVNTVDYFK